MRTGSASRKSASRPVYITSIPRDVVTSRLRVGQVIRGTVLEQIAENMYIINFRGFNLNSRSKRKFKRGKQIFVRVVDMKDQIIMELVPESDYRDARSEASAAELETRLEEMGIPPTPLNTLIANALLRFGMPLSLESFSAVLEDASSLGIDSEEDFHALAYLRASRYPVSLENIGLAGFLDFPSGSSLLGEIMSMTPRPLTTGEGLPVRVFDAEDKTAVCFRYEGKHLGIVKVLALIDRGGVRTELICSEETQPGVLSKHEGCLEHLLAVIGLDLTGLKTILDTPGKTRNAVNSSPRFQIGIDFKV